MYMYLTIVTRQINICQGFFTYDSRPCLRHIQKTRLFPFCLQMKKVCCGSSSRGTAVFLPHLKTSARLFMPFFKIAKLAPHKCFQFVDIMTVSECLCLVYSVSCSPLHDIEARTDRLKMDTTTTIALLNWNT